MTPDNREEQVQEALERLAMFASLSEAGPSAAQVGAATATIRAHIEALEARSQKLEMDNRSLKQSVTAALHARGPEGFKERLDIAEARVRELEVRASQAEALALRLAAQLTAAESTIEDMRLQYLADAARLS